MSKDSEKGQHDKAKGKGYNPPCSSISETLFGNKNARDSKRISDYKSGFRGTKKGK